MQTCQISHSRAFKVDKAFIADMANSLAEELTKKMYSK
jgi:hypothetical protein